MPQTTNELRRDGIELPWSSPTRVGRYRSFAKLLFRVDPGAMTGFGFHGHLCKPGSMVFKWQLWPNEEYPAAPVMLEYVAQNGRTRAEQKDGSLYVLWRLDPDTARWQELARASGVGTEWTLVLGPIARHALKTALQPPRKPMGKADVGAIAGRIVSFLDGELARVEAENVIAVLDAVHNELAMRMCQAA